MRYLRFAAAGILFSSFAVDLAVAGITAPCPSSVCYTEVGDAGDRFTPQNITGGPFQGIEGDIGGPTPPPKDQFDAFRFFFGGGTLSAIFTPPADIELRLFTDALAEIIPAADSIGVETWTGLSAANYILEVEALIDPPFQIGLFSLTPTPISPPTTPTRVPEPGVGALLLLGLAVLAIRRRRES